MKQFRQFFSFLAILIAAISVGNLAKAGPPAVSDIRLISEKTAVGESREVILGVHIKLETGWKTYWRTPGDSGIPPQFDWSKSRNIENAQIEWPKPYAFDTFGLQTWGYKDEVVFPVRVTLKSTGQPIEANLQIFFGVCEQVCIPINQTIQMQLPSGHPEMTPDAALLKQYRTAVPRPLQSTENMTISASSNASLNVAFISPMPLDSPALILEGEEGDVFTVSSARIGPSGQSATFEIAADLVNRALPLSGRSVTATLLDKSIAVESQVTIQHDK
ncbi:MAG: protein-disulfide reductase DsbD domain-containing protein [Sneathiella sp.]